MRATARMRVFALLAGVIAASGAGGSSIAAATTTSAAAALTGRLMVAHGDNFGGGPMVMKTTLQTATGVVPLVAPASQHSQLVALAGEQVNVVGSRISAV